VWHHGSTGAAETLSSTKSLRQFELQRFSCAG